MAVTIDQLKIDLASLPAADRAELIEHLILSLDTSIDEDGAIAWETEIRHRVQPIRTGQAMGRPAEEVFAEMRAKYR